jgi:hypothetical protein
MARKFCAIMLIYFLTGINFSKEIIVHENRRNVLRMMCSWLMKVML